MILMFAAALVCAGCSKDEGNSVEPSLLVEPTGISASADGGTYTFTVGSNTKWSVTVAVGATWCAVSPKTGTGNGTVVVNITENAATVTRTTVVTVTADTLSKTVNVTQDALSLYQYEATDAPANAVSDTVWVFGNQTWSDAIHILECNKSTFEESFTNPQCRSYTYEGNTYYYYNWPYVNTYANELCPSPWHVPTRTDFDKLENITHTNMVRLQHLWGFGGLALRISLLNTADDAFYWSFTELTAEIAYAFHYPTGGGIPVEYNHFKLLGYQVRCVK
jgi:hypothetical protein